MSIVKISGNLNIQGDQGRFQTDPSTWGFALTSVDYYIDRNSTNYYTGGAALRNRTLRSTFPGTNKLFGAQGAINASPGKLYMCEAYVYVDPTSPIASNGALIKMESAQMSIYTGQINKAVAIAKGGWTQIQCVFTAGTSNGIAIFNVNVVNPASETVNYNGILYIDDFSIWEVEDVPENGAVIQIDIDNCVIIDESVSGANDGSMQIAVLTENTTAPIYYSKDNGATWQTSNQFTGLAPGTYQVKVKDSTGTPATDSATFAINAGDISGPNFDFTCEVQNESTAGANDGKITVNVTGAGTPFTYSKDGGSTYQSSNVFSFLAPATYTIVVKDLNNFTVQHNITVAAGTGVHSIAFDLAHCYVQNSTYGANDGKLTLAVTKSNCTDPIYYSKDNGATWQTSNIFSGLAAGVYHCKIKDSALTPVTASQDFTVNTVGSGNPPFGIIVSIKDCTVKGANDGGIGIQIGAAYDTSPYQYTFDGGVTWQSLNYKLDLAPGTYAVGAKDVNGYAAYMNAVVHDGAAAFQEVHFNRDPILFQLPQSASAGEYNYKRFIDIRVEDTPGSGSYISKMKAAIAPDANGICQFNLRQAFRGVITPDVPGYGSSVITKLTNQCKFYKIYYGDIWDYTTEPASYSNTNPFKIMMGGLSKRYFPQVDFFTTYLKDNHTFMTWRPYEKDIDLQQEDFVNFWVSSSGILQIKLIIKAYYDDNTYTIAETKTTSGVQYGDLYRIPVGTLNSGVSSINTAKNLIAYEYWLRDQNSSNISEIKKCKVTPYKIPNTAYLLAMNSLGSFEVIRMTGNRISSAEFDRTIIRKNLPLGYAYDAGEYAMGNNFKTLRFSFSTGLIHTKSINEWIEYYQELLLTPYLYNVTGQDRIPLIIDTKSMKITQDGDNRKFLRLEAYEAYNDHSYTPISQ